MRDFHDSNALQNLGTADKLWQIDKSGKQQLFQIMIANDL